MCLIAARVGARPSYRSVGVIPSLCAVRTTRRTRPRRCCQQRPSWARSRTAGSLGAVRLCLCGPAIDPELPLEPARPFRKSVYHQVRGLDETGKITWEAIRRCAAAFPGGHHNPAVRPDQSGRFADHGDMVGKELHDVDRDHCVAAPIDQAGAPHVRDLPARTGHARKVVLPPAGVASGTNENGWTASRGPSPSSSACTVLARQRR